MLFSLNGNKKINKQINKYVFKNTTQNKIVIHFQYLGI